jgi:GT2 family glycosyltransferase
VSRALRDPRRGLHPYAAFGSTSNLGVRLELARALPFDEGYRFASEDRDWCVRLSAAGYELAVVPEACVVHHRNDDLGEFWRRYVRYGEGSYRFRQIHSSGRPARSGFYGRLLRAGFEQGLIIGALVGVSQLATAVGYARAAQTAGRT